MITAFISCLWKCKYNCKRGRWWRHDSLQFHISYHQANLSSLHWNYTHRGGFTSLRLVKHGRNGFLNPLCEIPGVVIDYKGFIFSLVSFPSFFFCLTFYFYDLQQTRISAYFHFIKSYQQLKPLNHLACFVFLVFCFAFVS